MQTFALRRPVAALLCVLVLGACSRVDNPYQRIANPPVVQAGLRGVTLVGSDPASGDVLPGMGYQKVSFAANYPGAVRVHSLMWELPEPVVNDALEFRASGSKLPDVTLLVAAPPADSPAVDPALLASFYRNVLGSDVPRFPAKGDLPAGVRVHAWTFTVPDVLEANRKLREKSIAVIFSPVAITTPALGDHKVIAIRAPDGTLIELVETAAS